MILDNLQSSAKKMMIDFKESTSNIEHSGEKGKSREELLKKYLGEYIPNKYEIGNGTIIDSNDDQSRQQDVIIYDSFSSPVMLNMDSTKIIPIESVYSVIEVKSALNKSELNKCVENIKSVRSLLKCSMLEGNSTVGFVFSYTSDTSLEALRDNLIEFNEEVSPSKQISLICVLDKGLIVNMSKFGLKNIELIPTENSIPAIILNSKEKNLMLFYLLLMQYLNETRVSPPNLLEYAKKGDMLNFKKQFHLNHIPQDGFYEVNGQEVKLCSFDETLDSFQEICAGNASLDQILKYLSDNIEGLKQMMFAYNSNFFNFFGANFSIEQLEFVTKVFDDIETGKEIEEDVMKEYNNIKNKLYNQYKRYFE